MEISSSGQIIATGIMDIYGYDLKTEAEFPICTTDVTQGGAAISGNIVVWVDYRGNQGHIYGARLSRYQ